MLDVEGKWAEDMPCKGDIFRGKLGTGTFDILPRHFLSCLNELT